MGDATKHFSYWEVTSKSWPMQARKAWQPPAVQKIMIDHLYQQILQPIRDQYGRLDITNGIRLLGDYQRLIEQGYKPSWKSDHYFGQSVRVPPHQIDEFGNWYNLSVGAVDIVPAHARVRMVFDWMRRTFSPLAYGQLIYETHMHNDGREVEWIHVGNSKALIFADRIARMVAGAPVLVGQNGSYVALANT